MGERGRIKKGEGKGEKRGKERRGGEKNREGREEGKREKWEREVRGDGGRDRLLLPPPVYISCCDFLSSRKLFICKAHVRSY